MRINEIAQFAKSASIKLLAIKSDIKNKALLEISNALIERKEEIIIANKIDIERSEKENLAEPLLKRLKFDESKINEASEGLKSLAKLEDPVGKTLLSTELDEGLELYRVTCPIGVIGVIFESRPDALIQISSICLKSGNAALLKGGSEALETNRILADIIYKATVDSGIPEGWFSLLETRSDVNEMLKLDEYIDLIIPRGSNDFVRYIMDNSRIPVLGHADGICHCYVDVDASIDMAVKVVTDSKTQYVAVCNATETLLVHQDIASEYLPKIKQALLNKNVEIVGCELTNKYISVDLATEIDWQTEYLDYKISIKVVSNVEEAINHINKYGSGHTDVIVTNNKETALHFMSLVDSGNVLHNCSSRFSDGFRYGFGAEVGISTNKIHARGPVGLEGMVIYKYLLFGNGHIVDDYSNKIKTFKHLPLNKKF